MYVLLFLFWKLGVKIFQQLFRRKYQWTDEHKHETIKCRLFKNVIYAVKILGLEELLGYNHQGCMSQIYSLHLN